MSTEIIEKIPEAIALITTVSKGLDAARKGLDFFKDAKSLKDKQAIEEHASKERERLIEIKEQLLSLTEKMQAIREENLSLKRQIKDQAEQLQDKQDWSLIRTRLVNNSKGAYMLPEPPEGWEEGRIVLAVPTSIAN